MDFPKAAEQSWNRVPAAIPFPELNLVVPPLSSASPGTWLLDRKLSSPCQVLSASPAGRTLLLDLRGGSGQAPPGDFSMQWLLINAYSVLGNAPSGFNEHLNHREIGGWSLPAHTPPPDSVGLERGLGSSVKPALHVVLIQQARGPQACKYCSGHPNGANPQWTS